MGKDPLIKLDLGHDGILPTLFHELAEGLGELGMGHGIIEVGLHNGVGFFLKLESLMKLVSLEDLDVE